MAALGAVTPVEIGRPLPSVVFPVTDYNVVRGKYLGEVTVFEPSHPVPILHEASNYIVRQIRVVYRQLWPNHGQRFPQ